MLATAPDAAWREPTQFKAWTFDDIVGHLYLFDVVAEIAARSRAEFEAFYGEIVASAKQGVTLRAYAAALARGLQRSRIAGPMAGAVPAARADRELPSSPTGAWPGPVRT